jgi:perosamine synthetase
VKIPITKPWFDMDEEQSVIEVLRSRHVSQGYKVREFEEVFANYVSAKYVTAVSSCTTALHMAMVAAGIAPGNEVIVPALTFVSTINAVELVGATPVFCDIDRSTFNIDVEDVRKKITSRTKAIVPVHLFGLAAEMSAIIEISQRNNLLVMEDAACALGSFYKQKHVGLFGDISCFSFHPRKSITTGEGGMLVTANAEYHQKFLKLRNIGSDRHYPIPDYPLVGFNYRMTDLQAAVGVSQFRKLNSILERRRSSAEYYLKLIRESHLSEWLEVPFTPNDCIHAYQAFVCQLKQSVEGTRNNLITALAADEIEVRQGTHAPYLLSYYRTKYGFGLADFPNAFAADRFSLALPLYPELTREDQRFVCTQLENHLRRLLSL